MSSDETNLTILFPIEQLIKNHNDIFYIKDGFGNYAYDIKNIYQLPTFLFNTVKDIKENEWKPFKDFKKPDEGVCENCWGELKNGDHCEECDGDGEVELSNDFHTYYCDCKSCDGSGDPKPCKKCLGLGINPFSIINLDNINFYDIPFKWASPLFYVSNFDNANYYTKARNGYPILIIKSDKFIFIFNF